MKIQYIPMNKIREPIDPARKNFNHTAQEELTDSIKDVGLLQPILLKHTTNNEYEIEAGHRRYRSMRQLRWEMTPAIIIGRTDEKDIHIERAHENLIREELSLIDEAKMVDTLVNENERGIEGTSILIKKPLSWINNRLEALSYQDDLKEALNKEQISLSTAKELSKCKEDDYRKKLTEYIIDTGASAKTVKMWVNDSNIKKFSEALERSKEVGIIQRADLGPTYMECGICVSRLPIEELRHIFLCAVCMEGIKQIREDTGKNTGTEEDYD